MLNVGNLRCGFQLRLFNVTARNCGFCLLFILFDLTFALQVVALDIVQVDFFILAYCEGGAQEAEQKKEVFLKTKINCVNFKLLS